MIENQNNISEEEIITSEEEISAEDVSNIESDAEQPNQTYATKQNNSKNK